MSNQTSDNITGSYANSSVSSTTTLTVLGDDVDTRHSGGDLSVSYIYAVIGVVCILCEVILLCLIYCYCNKKLCLPLGRYRRTSRGSVAASEDVIKPETTSPTKALCSNAVYDDDSVLKEDQSIYHSYRNLRYIDDISLERTPEKSIIKSK